MTRGFFLLSLFPPDYLFYFFSFWYFFYLGKATQAFLIVVACGLPSTLLAQLLSLPALGAHASSPLLPDTVTPPRTFSFPSEREREGGVDAVSSNVEVPLLNALASVPSSLI